MFRFNFVDFLPWIPHLSYVACTTVYGLVYICDSSFSLVVYQYMFVCFLDVFEGEICTCIPIGLKFLAR